MSAPINDADLVHVDEAPCFNPEKVVIARIRALEAEREALRAEVARKDEALRQIADPRNWEEQDRARSIARTALGPWRPTHQSRERDHIKVREVGRGYGPDRLIQMVLYEGPPPGNSHVLYADIFGDHYRPLTPDEQRAYLATLGRERDDAMTTHPDSDRRG